MAKRNKSRYNKKVRAEREAKIQERELMEEFWGDAMEDVAKDVAEDVVSTQEEDFAKNQKWYVLDTNLLLSCVNVLYDPEDEHWREPLDFEPDLKDAHLIIPEIVKDELNRIKDEKSFNGIAARTALKRLAKMLANSGRSLDEIAHLAHPMPTGLGKQTISVLPIYNHFNRCLPWRTRLDDNDAWIAATALEAKMLRRKLLIDGSRVYAEEVARLHSGDPDVVLLTNDADLLEKADRYAVSSSRYSFGQRRPYNGCRELVVPPEMFEQFFHEECLSREDFEYYMPDEPPLVANEYIIMEPENDKYPRSYFVASAKSFGNIARYHKENGMLYPMRFMRREGVTPPNAGIAAYYDALNDDKLNVITVEGAAGTGKTFQAVIHAIREVKAGKKAKIVLVSSKESKNPLGALPGKKKDKMAPLVATCKSAIAAYLINTPEFKKKREKLRKYGDMDEERFYNYLLYSYLNGSSDSGGRDDRDSYDYDKAGKRKKPKANYEYDYAASDDMVGGFEKTRKSSRKKSKGGAYEADGLALDKQSSNMTYEEFLRKHVDYIFDRYFECYPREEVDGMTFHDAFIIVDEIQRIHDLEELLTILTRSAETSKMVLCGDTKQIRKSTNEKLLNNGITYAKARYFDWERAACICLTENMRGGGSAYETEDYAEAYARIAGI